MIFNIRGFSLIELLVALSIVAIVTGIALPSWRNHLHVARRVDATGALLHIGARQEIFRIQNQHYADRAALGISKRTTDGHYDLHVSTTSSGFNATATATSNGRQSGDKNCRSFGIDETGRRWARSASGADTTRLCWDL